MTDFVIVLNSRDAVKHLQKVVKRKKYNVTLGGNLSVVAGPLDVQLTFSTVNSINNLK